MTEYESGAIKLSVPWDYNMTPCRKIFDSIYPESIPIFPFMVPFIDSPEFQRLRGIQQLGTTSYVWPSANHTRFQHSLGVAYLAWKMMTVLQQRQPELNITSREIACVTIAGLCHDLGHGPFSHVWDGMVIPEIYGKNQWSHEEASEMMLEILVRNNNINMPPQDLELIKSLIAGDHSRTPTEKKFMYDIVSNKKNGLDVDKLDYLCRDTEVVRMGTSAFHDLWRVIDCARVCPSDGHIGYARKEIPTAHAVYKNRFDLHDRFYGHKTVRAVGYMVQDALVAANGYMKFEEAIRRPERYVHLTDSIMEKIKETTCPELEVSRQIIKRIDTRDLYKLAGSRKMRPSDYARICDYINQERVVEAAILCSKEMSPEEKELASALRPSDVIVEFTSRNFGMGEQNPMDFLKFYSPENLNEFFTAQELGDYDPQETVCQYLLRVYVKKKEFVNVVKAGYHQLEKKLFDNSIPMSSPPTTDTS